MTSDKMKVETGLQLLARLSKKMAIANFYPKLFRSGPKIDHIIELYSNQSAHHLLEDIVSESLIPIELGGVEASVLVLNTDGYLHIDNIMMSLRKKIRIRVQSNMLDYDSNSLQNLISNAIKHLFTIDIYDVTQFYTTLQNLENVLSKHSNISLVAINSLTAFYWSEQGYKITKMKLYIRTLVSLLQKITKDHKVTLLYIRPEYFNGSKENINYLEKCCENPTAERINYRIHVVYSTNNTHYVDIQTHNEVKRLEFQISDDVVEWVI